MNKLLRFEIKHSQRKPSRIYIKSPDLKVNYGHFYADRPTDFTAWELLSPEQQIELKLFIQNIDAVNTLFGKEASSKLTDFRFRLPMDFIELINEVGMLLTEQGIVFNLFESAITGMIQQLKIGTTKLDENRKQKALASLDKIGLAEYKKIDLTSQIQAVFSELLAIHNKSEKLHDKALTLFNKDKSYSPNAIQGMTTGDSIPAKWLVACAIDLLIDERLSILKTVLSENDIFLLWAKQLLDNGFNQEALLTKINELQILGLETRIKDYSNHTKGQK